jgi:microcin C transport system substrate-binding protein
MRRGDAGALLAALALLAAAPAGAEPRHGISLFGELDYPADFKHFRYADPQAPKGGVLRIAGGDTFDSLHGFIRKGRAAQGLQYTESYIHDRLTARAEDEPATRYGLLARTIELAPDGRWIEFELRPEARWHDGRPVTADDVVFTFQTIKKQGTPPLQILYAKVPSVEKRGPRTVRFTLLDPNDRQLPFAVAELYVLPKHYWEGREFERTTLDPPLGSGPYRIGRVERGRSITYERVPDYWAKDLPANAGHYNFDRIKVEYFQDTDVRLEALKGDVIDMANETVSKTWAEGYDFPARRRGHFVLEQIDSDSPSTVRALLFNTRLAKFKDPRVRQALAYAYDREWTNRVQGHNTYLPSDTYFAGSDLAQRGAPAGPELALLEPYRAQLPPELFERGFAIPRTPGIGRNRDNLRVAARLLREAGYVLRDGVLVNAKSGEPLRVDMLLDSASRIRMTLHYADALRRLGIESTMRVLATSQLIHRRRALDFEMIYVFYPVSITPGTQLRTYFSSASASIPNTQNYAGVQNPVVDRLIEKVLAAGTEEEHAVACRALDRVLLWNYYMIDLGYQPGLRMAHWDRFGRPPERARFQTARFVHTWWFDAGKDARIRAGDAAADAER